MLEVVKDIRKAAERFRNPAPSPREPTSSPSSTTTGAGPRSSNLRLAKSFTDRDKDRFRVEAFEFMAKYFENSLAELSQRNDGIDGDFRRVDANRFTVAVYRGGKVVTRCTIFMGGGFSGNGISYVDGETTGSNGYNENLRVEADEQSLFLHSMGMRSFGGHREEHLTLEGAAEIYWSMFIGRLQGGVS